MQSLLGKFKDTYFILQNKYLCIYEDSFEVKILRNDWALNKPKILFNLRVMCKAKITVSVKLL